MDKRKRTIIALGATCLVLLGGYFGILRWNESQEVKATNAEEAEKIYITDYNGLTELAFNVGSGDMHFVKTEEEWQVADYSKFPLQQEYVERMEQDLIHLQAERELKEADSLADYGLEEPVYTITMKSSEGEEHSLYIGNTIGESYYAALDDKAVVYTISSVLLSDLQYSLEELAQLDTVPAIGSGNLVKVIIENNKETTTYESENEEDTESIATVAGGLGAMSLDTAVDYGVSEDEKLLNYGLTEEKRITVTAEYTSDEDTETFTAYIGAEDGSGNRYVMVKGSETVYQVSNEVCANILDEED